MRALEAVVILDGDAWVRLLTFGLYEVPGLDDGANLGGGKGDHDTPLRFTGNTL